MTTFLEKLEHALHEKTKKLSPRSSPSHTPTGKGTLTPPVVHELDYDATRRSSHGMLSFDETRRPSHPDRPQGTPPPMGTSHDPPVHVKLDPGKKPKALLCTNCKRQMSYESSCLLCPQDHSLFCAQCAANNMQSKHDPSHELYDLTIRRPRYVGGFVPAHCSSCGNYYEIAHDHYTGARCNRCEEKQVHLDICGNCLEGKEKVGYRMLVKHEEEVHKGEEGRASWTLFKGPGIVVGAGPAARAGW